MALSSEVNNSVSSLPNSTARLISDMIGSVQVGAYLTQQAILLAGIT
ncbi:hypothetical protein BN136_2760 [Cronobacter universalis NCTC 9529]|nr:hypothetical protein BN131_2605 [Cronobacter malonaticus 681]CCK16750.1 hypothetical protein BN136_2760 [Cronobacter universalis NCTC 9529]